MRLWSIFGTIVVWCAAAAPPANAQSPQVQPIAERPFRGELEGIGTGGRFAFRHEGKTRTLAADELARWGDFVDSAKLPLLILDGGIIAADQITVSGDEVEAHTKTFGRVRFAIPQAKGLVFRVPLEQLARDRLIFRISAAHGDQDKLLLENGDELTGTISRLDAEQIALDAPSGQLEMPTVNVQAVIFNPALAATRSELGPRVLVGFEDGSRLSVSSLTSQRKVVTLRLNGGSVLKAPLRSIVAVQPLGGRVVYLSDLKPSSYRHVPYLALSWPFSADQNVLGGLLRLPQGLYPKGIGMHSAARLTYDLDAPYRRFEAEVAIDGSAAQRGSVTVSVLVDDGSGGWQNKLKSPVIRGGEPPKAISVELAGAKRLSLLVDFADRADEWDHVNWLNARLMR